MLAARSLVRLWLERLVAVPVADRAVALAALAFTVLIPLFIVYDEVVPAIDGRDFATGLVDRFELKGAAAASLRQWNRRRCIRVPVLVGGSRLRGRGLRRGRRCVDRTAREATER